MQSFLQGLGVFFLLLIALLLLIIVVIAVFFVLLLRSFSSTTLIDQQAKDYIRNAIDVIAQHWSLQSLIQRASPRLIESETSENWQANLDQCNYYLGHLTVYKGAKGSLQGMPIASAIIPFIRIFAKKSDFQGSENLLIAEYSAEAEFERGNATLELQLLKQEQGQDWLINFLEITITNPEGTVDLKSPLSFGSKTTMDQLMEDTRKRMALEKRLSN